MSLFKRDSLAVILDRVYNNYMSRFKPLEKTPRYNLLRVLAAVEAGTYHQLLGDLSFLSDQLFPDTATGEYLRLHWSDRVPPLYATPAVGNLRITGSVDAAVPAGLVFAAPNGKKFYTDKAARISEGGYIDVSVTAEEGGALSNLAAEIEVSLISSTPAGIDSVATVSAGGLAGGVDGETDAEYLSRVLLYLRNNVRYGKPGDFAAWAVDSSAEVTKAWEIKNFGPLGALLIQVVGGNQIDGVLQVGNLSIVHNYIDTVAPPVIYTVKTPDLVPINPSIALSPAEDTTENREIVLGRLQTFLQATASPGYSYSAGQLRDAIIDGIIITDATVLIDGSISGIVSTTVLEYPVLGDVSWT